jgi:hypothetical protein
VCAGEEKGEKIQILPNTRSGIARPARPRQGGFNRPDGANQRGDSAIGQRIEIGWTRSGRLEPRMQRPSFSFFSLLSGGLASIGPADGEAATQEFSIGAGSGKA